MLTSDVSVVLSERLRRTDIMYDHLDRLIALGHRSAIEYNGKFWYYHEHNVDEEGPYIELRRNLAPAVTRILSLAVTAAATCALAGIVLLATALDARAETDMLVFGKSWHHGKQSQYFYNEVNPGLGLEWRRSADSRWIVGGFALEDSRKNIGGAVYGGWRYTYPLTGHWRLEATLRAGWLKDGAYNGPAVLPTIGVGYKRLTIEATYMPSFGSDRSKGAAVVFARWRF